MSHSKSNIPFAPLVEILSFYNRNKLDRFSTTSKFLNQVIQQNFRSKPYRIWKNVEIELIIRLNGRKKLRFELIRGKHIYYIETRTWRNVNDLPFGQNLCYSLDTMRRYLPLFVRIFNVRIYIGNDMFSPKNIEDLRSMAHVWNGQKVHIDSLTNNQEARCLILDRILSSTNLIRCHWLTITNLSGILLHEQNHLTLYNLQILQLDDFLYTRNLAEFILNFIRSKVRYPESETLLIVNIDSGIRLRHVPPIQLDSDFDLVDQIRKDFTTSATPNRFCLVLNCRYRKNADFHKISLPLCDFRIENSATNEVLQFEKTYSWKKVEILKKFRQPNFYLHCDYILARFFE